LAAFKGKQEVVCFYKKLFAVLFQFKLGFCWDFCQDIQNLYKGNNIEFPIALEDEK
jgi:hypothetical protein